MAQQTEICQIESLENFTEFAFEQGWTDGLPVFPPTRKVVDGMLNYLGRDPLEVLGTVFPGDGDATIGKIVANCAMAGCLPEHVPVVLAAVEGLVDPTLIISTTQSTGAAGIFTMVSGPVVRTLNFHTREWIFGPNGGRANTAIGRAIRLVLWNIGRAHPGKLIKGTMGHPAAWSYCIGEEQELTPWEPAHVDFGLDAKDSAVTVMKAGDHCQFGVPLNIVGVNECITLLARGIGRLGMSMGHAQRAYLFVINPSVARAFAQAGYTREKLRTAIAERSLKYTYDWQLGGHPLPGAVKCDDIYPQIPSERDIYVCPVTPDEICLVVGGGDSATMGQCVSISSRNNRGKPMVTKKIRLPA